MKSRIAGILRQPSRPLGQVEYRKLFEVDSRIVPAGDKKCQGSELASRVESFRDTGLVPGTCCTA